MKILGIVTKTHDAGLALLEDGIPVLVLEEEHFNREKHTQEFPRLSLEAAFAQKRLPVRDMEDASWAGFRVDSKWVRVPSAIAQYWLILATLR